MVVDLSGVQAKGATTTIQTLISTPVLPPLANTAEPSGDITAAINQQLMGAMECLQQTSPSPQPLSSGTALHRNSHHLQLRGLCQQPENQKIPSGQRGWTPSPPVPMATLMETSLQVAIPAGTLSFAHVTPQLLQPTLSKTLQMVGIPLSHGLRPPPSVDQSVS